MRPCSAECARCIGVRDAGELPAGLAGSHDVAGCACNARARNLLARNLLARTWPSTGTSVLKYTPTPTRSATAHSCEHT